MLKTKSLNVTEILAEIVITVSNRRTTADDFRLDSRGQCIISSYTSVISVFHFSFFRFSFVDV